MIPADAAPALSAACPGPAPTDARALVEEQMAMLSKLARIGMAIAEECGRAATDGGEAADPKAAGLVFARVARAVRMTIALQQRLARDLSDLDQADERARMQDRDDRRFRLGRLLRRAAEAEIAARRNAGDRRFADEDAAEIGIEQLSAEAYERLTEAEDFDLAGRPFHEVVAGICADLGMAPEWAARVVAAVQPPAARAQTPLRGGGAGEAGVWSAQDRPRGCGALSAAEAPQGPLHHAAPGAPPPLYGRG